MQKNIFFKLFACCIPVLGHSRSALYDLQRNGFEYIPNLFYDLLKECNHLSAADLRARYTEPEWKGVEKFLGYLVENEYGFWTDSPEEFPDLSMQWDHPGKLTNAIIEYKKDYSPYKLNNLFDTLEELRCSDIQLRLFGSFSLDSIRQIVDSFYGRYFCVIDLFIPFNPAWDIEDLLVLLKKEHRIIPLTIYNCPDRSIRNHIREDDKFLLSRVHISSETFYPGKIKEQIHFSSFYINTEFFTESQQFNTGLNRKIAIDIDGNIRNHISHKRIFGNLAKDKPGSIIEGAGFQRLWKITNDEIEICRICEHRYMCMSNSDIMLRKNKFYKKTMCTYDPVTATWEDQDQ